MSADMLIDTEVLAYGLAAVLLVATAVLAALTRTVLREARRLTAERALGDVAGSLHDLGRHARAKTAPAARRPQPIRRL